MISERCAKCGLVMTGSDLSNIPYLKFNWLKGTPVICEKCVAKAFGIESDWCDKVLLDRMKTTIE